MKWFGISGSWRQTTDELEKDLAETVSQILVAGDGIITGGALGIDYLATQQVIRQDTQLKLLKVFLPTNLSIYIKHYQKRAQEGIISQKQAQKLVQQLKTLKNINPDSLIEDLTTKTVTKKVYYARNTTIVQNSDELVAFWINRSEGTGDAIKKAQKLGKKVTIFEYSVADKA